MNGTKEVYIRDAQGNVIAVYEIKKKNNIDSLFTNEFHIFGSNRLGYLMDKKYLARKTYGKTLGGAIPALPVNPIISIPNPFILPGTTSITLLYFGNKRYELSDWLGNVRVVINDKKTPVNSGTTTVSYLPQVMSVSDYYSFGSQIAERSYDPVKPLYRFGFNTQEKVNEISLNHYTAKYWEYDARLGKRWNVDPVTKPWQSSYSCLSNSPMWKVDPNGDDDYYDKKGKYLGSFGEKNDVMRVVESKEVFNEVTKTGIHAGKIIKIDYSTIDVVKQIANNTFATGKEWAGYFVFDPDKAEISAKIFRPGSNYSNIESWVPEKKEFEEKNPGLVYLATIHAHPRVENETRENVPGPSSRDFKSIDQTQVPDYIIDAYKLEHVTTVNGYAGKGGISVINTDKTSQGNLTELGKIGLGTGKFNIGKDAFERQSGKNKSQGKIDDINNSPQK